MSSGGETPTSDVGPSDKATDRPLFRELSPDDDLETSEMESLCMTCAEMVSIVIKHVNRSADQIRVDTFDVTGR